MRCEYCGYDNDDNSKYCCMCGAKLESNITPKITGYVPIDRNKETEAIPEEYEDLEVEPEVKEHIKATLITIAIVSLISLGICFTIEQYGYPSIGMSYDSSFYDEVTAVQGEGVVCANGENLYFAMEGSIYQYDKYLEEVDVIVESYGEDLFVYNDCLYYVDENNNCISVNLETREQETILENVFYVTCLEGVITYQNDNDNESIHQYDIETKTDIKINNVVSYSMIAVGDVIYYINIEGSLFMLTDDGSQEIAPNINGFTVYNEDVYFSNSTGIMKYSTDGELESVVAIENALDVCFVDDKLVFNDYYGKVYGHVEGDSYTVYEESSAYNIESLGNLFFYYHINDGCFYVSDMQGNRIVLYAGLMHSSYREEVDFEWEGVESF